MQRGRKKKQKEMWVSTIGIYSLHGNMSTTIVIND